MFKMKIFIIILNVYILGGSVAVGEKFGHEDGDFNTPNILSTENTELGYALETKAKYNKWYAKNIETAVTDGASCFKGKCLNVSGRPDDDEKRWAVYRADIDGVFDAGFKYMFNMMIKFTVDDRSPSVPVIDVTLMSKGKYVNPANHGGKKTLVKQENTVDFMLDGEWQLLSWVYDFVNLDVSEFKFIEFFAKIPNGVEFLIDAASLTKISYPNWKNEALASIEDIRKGTITVTGLTGVNCAVPVSIRVQQTRRDYPFGVAVDPKIIGNISQTNATKVKLYRDWVKKRGTWAVYANGAKWKQMECCQQIDNDDKYIVTDAAFSYLNANGISVRGHAYHWNKLDNTPIWVANKTDKKAAIDRRTEYMANHFKNKFKQFDVCNECRSSRLYQDWTGIQDIQAYLHNHTKSIDGNMKLFLNDWGNLQRTQNFMETVSQVRHLRGLGLIDGIGLQGHLQPENDKIDMELIRRNLEILGSLNVPIWITEHSIDHPDPVKRGELLQDSMTMFYGFPQVHGIIHWNPSPNAGTKLVNTALFDRDTMENNAAGDALDDLLASWTTDEVVGPAETSADSLSTSAFFGTHNVTIICGNNVVKTFNNVTITPGSPSAVRPYNSQ